MEQNKTNHKHENHNHNHNHSEEYKNKDPQKLLISALLIFTFMFVELIGGLWSNSLALISDSIHMLSDFVALVMAFVAAYFANKPNFNKDKYERMPVLVAYTNILALFIVTGFIFYHAILRFVTPESVMSNEMLVIAVIGLLINIIVFMILNTGQKEKNINMKGAILHVMGDLLGSVAAIVASIVIILTGWTPIDPILSVLICLIIMHQSYPVFKESIFSLMKK